MGIMDLENNLRVECLSDKVVPVSVVDKVMPPGSGKMTTDEEWCREMWNQIYWRVECLCHPRSETSSPVALYYNIEPLTPELHQKYPWYWDLRTLCEQASAILSRVKADNGNALFPVDLNTVDFYGVETFFKNACGDLQWSSNVQDLRDIQQRVNQVNGMLAVFGSWFGTQWYKDNKIAIQKTNPKLFLP